jgi:hypothetical protein
VKKKTNVEINLRTQLAVIRLGKSAQYPLCLAALDLWKVYADLSGQARDAELSWEVLNSAKRQKEQARALRSAFQKAQQKKELEEASALLCKIDEHLLKAQRCFRALVGLFSLTLEELRPIAVARFERECDAVVRVKNVEAVNALHRVKKRWSIGGNGSAHPISAKIETLKILRRKAIKAAQTKGGAIAGYMEAAFGGDRSLSDEYFSGRLTAREVHSHLMDVGGVRLAGDKDAKEVRRLAGRLGLRLAEDKRGRKPAKLPCRAKQPPTPSRPCGRPRSKVELVFYEDLGVIEAQQAARNRRGDNPKPGCSPGIREQEDVAQAIRESQSIDRDIARLTRRREARGIKPARKLEGTIKGRSAVFAAFLDSD